MSRVSRLFELISILRARRTPVTASQLAHELGISQRSIYRDIETLRSLGAPLEGQAGIGYCLGKTFFLPEFAFSTNEMDALILGLSWVQQRGDNALSQCSESVLAKILTTRNDDPIMSHEPPVLVTAASAFDSVPCPEVALLRDAIHRQRKVSIGYEDAHGLLSERTIWPVIIVYFDDVHILAAWCEHRAAFRNFRVDRLKVKGISEELYPGQRQSLVTRWMQQDRDWRSLLTVSGTSPGYP